MAVIVTTTIETTATLPSLKDQGRRQGHCLGPPNIIEAPLVTQSSAAGTPRQQDSPQREEGHREGMDG
jgi:hypothetical protein